IGNTDGHLFGDGSVTMDPCEQTRQEALAIRQTSCAPCHGPGSVVSPTAVAKFTFVLDDAKLVTSKASNSQAYVTPGDPTNSYVYQRMSAGTMPPPPSIATTYLMGAAKTLTYPSESDISIMYEWILNCVDGTDGGAHASSSYGGGVNGTMCFGPCGGNGGAAGSAPDAAAPPSGPSGPSDAGRRD
ncbi:MAG: hypothetical protein JOZ69_09320, partial [Myxococcales bacterium]|nr:hypothetical protein [Myxococcales bacterium]